MRLGKTRFGPEIVIIVIGQLLILHARQASSDVVGCGAPGQRSAPGRTLMLLSSKGLRKYLGVSSGVIHGVALWAEDRRQAMVILLRRR
jgi:hypothetical protein